MKQLILQLLAAITFTPADHTASDPVCIVGAGPAGLTIAHRLQEKGLSTVIFDKNPEAGGKCQAFYDDDKNRDIFHPLGALLFSNDTYKETLPIINASGVQAMPFVYNNSNWMYEWKTGALIKAPPVSVLYPIFQAEVDKYIKLWKNEFAPLNISVGYKHGVPKEYTIPASEWLAKNDLKLLSVLFIEGMVPYGYGDLRETPIIYMLQYFTPDILRFFAGQQVGYIIDFHQVFVRYASSLKGSVHLSTNVTKIDRSSGHPVITYQTSTSTGTQHCDKLVLAFPPVMHALNAAKLDLSVNETEVFSPIGTTKYWSGAVSVATPNGTIFAAAPVPPNVPPPAAGEPVAFLRLFNESNVATTWSWGKYKSNQTLEEARGLLKETISKLNKDPTNSTETPKPVTDADIKAFKDWDYFPHYDPPQLEKGYIRFNNLQGEQNTYYASGFNGFETVEFAIRAGNDIVDTHFT